mgnify:CR=1 FL=1
MGLLLLPGSGCKDEPKAPADPLDDPWVDGIDEELGADEPAEVAAAKVEAPENAAPQAEPDAEKDDPPAADEGAAEPEPAEEPTKEDVVAKAEARPEPAAKKPAASAKKPAKPSTPEPSPAEPAAPTKDANEEPEAETPPEAEPAPAVEPAPAPAPTKPPEPAPFTIADFNGKYRYVGGDRQRKALEQAIETAAEQLNVVIRKIGRKRLTETNPIDPSLEIIVTADKVKTIFSKSGFDAECKVDGPTISYTNKKGKKLKVRVRRSKNKLVQSIADSDGVKTTVFVLSKDRSRLTVHHKVTADRLDSPMTYKLSYARK